MGSTVPKSIDSAMRSTIGKSPQKTMSASVHAKDHPVQPGSTIGCHGINSPPSTNIPQPEPNDHAKSSQTSTHANALQRPTEHHRPFNLFSRLLQHNDILLYLTTTHLPPRTLLTLYTISKPFHYLVNSHYTTYILSSARRWTLLPTSTSTYTSTPRPPSTTTTTTSILSLLPFTAYLHLCTHDPAHRPSLTSPIRHIPTFRYLLFLLFRHTTILSILHHLAHLGHNLPPCTAVAIAKLWFLLDIPSNAGRIALVHNRRYFADQDLYVASMFFMKLCMAFSDPVDGDGESGLVEMLLGQRSFNTLEGWLGRREGRSALEVLRMWVRWRWVPRPEHRGMSVLGVPAEEVGRGQLEGWGRGTQKLLRVDELVMAEGVRRGLGLDGRYVDMIRWGFMDPETGRDVGVPDEDVYGDSG